MQRKVITEMDASTIERLFRIGKTAKEVSEVIGCSVRTAQKYKMEFEQTASIQFKKRGRKNRENEPLKEGLSNLLALDPALTLKGLEESLPENLSVSKSHISRKLKEMGYSRKRLKLIVQERNSERIKNDRSLYCTHLLNIREDTMIFLDESGFNLHINQHYGYSLVGETAYKTVPTNRGRNISLVLAIAINGVVSFEIYDGAFNSNRMVEWINSSFQLFLQERSFNIVMDNAKFHHSAIVREAISGINCVQRFLPAYSPQLNPIEEVFSMVKARVRSHRPIPQNREELKSIIEETINGILSYDFSQFFRNMQEWALKGRQRVDFI